MYTPVPDTKIPKTLPPGKWTNRSFDTTKQSSWVPKQIFFLTFRHRFNWWKLFFSPEKNWVTLDKRRARWVPVREVLGAEVVIVSHLYTPLQLGEVLQFRSFTAGDINPLVGIAGGSQRESTADNTGGWALKVAALLTMYRKGQKDYLEFALYRRQGAGWESKSAAAPMGPLQEKKISWFRKGWIISGHCSP